MEYYSALKRKESLSCITAWTELEGIMVNEISQTEEDKYLMFSLVCGISEKSNLQSREWNDNYQSLGERGGERKREMLLKGYKVLVRLEE
jgi:hypothetical protein